VFEALAISWQIARMSAYKGAFIDNPSVYK